ncbi:MAG TPA: glycosyltransferase [Thermomicrobiaceae bacterium]|nr:glycosyltransferase [Thermomicrobiaceae bacterium]
MRQILYLGTYERDYPRNALTIKGLRHAGYDVRELHMPVWERQPDKTGRFLRPAALLRFAARMARAYLTLLARLPNALRGVDLVVIGYIGQADMLVFGPLLRLLHRPILFNPLVTLTDTLVEDRALLRPGSLAARLVALIDRLALALADAVLVDTPENGAFLIARFGVPAERLHWLPVGADEDLFRPLAQHRPPEPGQRLRVLFYGKMTPLHDAESIVIAAAHLGRCAEFTVIGQGQTGAAVRGIARILEADNIRFVDWVPFERLPQEIGQTDVVLGIFGDGGKAARVVPNKVYQAMAMGAAIVTRDGPAIRQVLDDGYSALLVPPDDSIALAHALRQLSAPVRRAELGAAAREAFLAIAGLDVQAARLTLVVEALARPAPLAVTEPAK